MFFGAGATGVCGSFSIPGDVAPMLAFEALNGLLFVFLWFETFQVDIETLVNGFVDCFQGYQGDQGMHHTLASFPLSQSSGFG